MTTSAVSTAPISVIKFLISEGGAVCGTDAVAQAVKAHVSSVPGRLEIVECLLDNGASIDAYAFQDATDSSMVAINGRETGLILATRGNKIDMVELLLKRGADRSLSTGISRLTKEETALEIAEKMRHENVARLLRCEYLE
jgi:ankyrin repeat protein